MVGDTDDFSFSVTDSVRELSVSASLDFCGDVSGRGGVDDKLSPVSIPSEDTYDGSELVVVSFVGLLSPVNLSTVPLSSVGVTVEIPRVVPEVDPVISSEESFSFGVVGRTLTLEVVRTSFDDEVFVSSVGITVGGVDEKGMEGVGGVRVEASDTIGSVPLPIPLSVEDSLILSDGFSLGSSDTNELDDVFVLNS